MGTSSVAKKTISGQRPLFFGRGESYYEDVTPGVTSGTEGGPGGGTSSTRQSDIALISSTAESVYGKKRQPKSDAHLDSRGRFITKL